MKLVIFSHRFSWVVAVAVAMIATPTFAQNAPDENPEPVDATVFDAAQAPQALRTGDPNQPKTAAMRMPIGTYRSDSLGGEFLGQFMRMTIGGNQNGQSFVFWGARAISLDQDSPLHDLSIRTGNGRVIPFQPGDVLTRLDGVPIENGKFQDRRGVWQLPELDEHFGPTTVRWIKTGHSFVNVSQIMLNNNATRGIGGGNVAPVTP